MERIFSANAPQFTEEEIRAMRDDFASQSEIIDLEYKPWYSAQWEVEKYDSEIDVVFLIFVGIAS